MSRQRGFTLIELLIVILVVAVLAAIAVSSYREQVRKSRRATAYNDVAQLQLQLERWRAENPAYCNLGDTGCPTFTVSGTYPNVATVSSNNTYYAITRPTATTTSYTLLAAPKGAQVGDRCGNLNANGNAKPTWDNTDCN